MRFVSLLLLVSTAAAQSFPPPDPLWKKNPAGFHKGRLQEALAFAMQQESSWDFAKDQVRVFGRPLGVVPAERARTNMVIVRNGQLVAEFGETNRPDPIYSAAKSFLSVVAGLAFDRGLIADPQLPVGQTMKDGGYDSAHNAKVTWHHHLQQSSEWEGEMWGKKHDFVGREEFGSGERKPRTLEEPGAHYEYNDVRVNRLSLSLLRLFGRPLPDVLKEAVMDPIGGSRTWQWLGYENSSITLKGKSMTSVPGGTRWGGGLQMSARDLARFGLLLLNNGEWNGRRILSEKWIRKSLTPSTVAGSPDYGYLWWLNSKGKQWPSAPRSSFAAIGNGTNIVWVDPEHKLVVVWRWCQGNAVDAFLGKLLAALEP